MIKVVYASLVFLLSSALVFLSKGNSHQGKCSMEVNGVVAASTVPGSNDLLIVTPDNKYYLPRISNDDVILVAGQHVRACALPKGVDANGTQVIAIHEIAVLP